MANAKRSILGVVLLVGLLVGEAPLAGLAAPASLYQSPYLVVSQDDNWKYSPAIAYASKHSVYLVVWENVWPNGHHDISGRLVAATGQLMFSEFTIYSGTNNSLQPAVTYDSTHDQFLVVWAYDAAGNGSNNDIYGRFIPWSGPVASQTKFVIDQGGENTDKPRVAYGLTYDEYLVVWKVEASPSYISGRLINDNNTGPLVTISTSNAPYLRDFPDVTYNLAGNEFVAVWDEDVNPGPTTQDLDVYARRVASNGTPNGPEFRVAGLSSNEQHPTVAACDKADQYLFVWQQAAPDDDLYGRWMNGSGELAPDSFFVGGTTAPEQVPRLSCNTAGTEYFLTWQVMYTNSRWGIWAKVIHTDQTMDSAFQVVAPNATRDRLFPAVAYGQGSALIAWEHSRDNSGWLDIWAQVIWTNLLPVSGLKVVSSSPTLLGQPTTLTATVTGGNFIVYTWRLGRGSLCCGSLVNYTFPAIGSYTAVVTATNALGSMTATTTVAIPGLYLPLVRR